MPLALGDINSTTGSISFDVNSDTQPETVLNNTGLGINTSPSANLHVNGNTIVSDQLVIGGSTLGQSNLHLNGSWSFSSEVVSSDTTLAGNSIVLVDTSSDNIILTLPEAGDVLGRVYKIKKTSTSHKVIIQGGGNIDGNADLILGPSSNYEYVSLISSADHQWSILASTGNTELVSADNLIAWWKFDEVSGSSTVSDSSGSRHDGTINSIAAGNVGVTGKFGRGISFDGNNDYVEIPHHSDLNLNGDWSVSTWYKRISFVNTWPGIIKKGSSGAGGQGYIIWYNSGGDVRLKRNNDSNLIASGAINDNEWVHLTVTYEGNTSKFYVNGSLMDTETPSFPTSNDTNVLWIGRGDHYGNAVIDDMRFYSKALSLTEIQVLTNLGQ